jgi:polyhydroxyalkanoate synthesis regulator phasin
VDMSRPNPSREAAEALRAAVDKTFQSTVDQASASRDRAQNRAQDIVDELSQAAGRVRDALDDLRVATREDLKELSDRLGSIESRLSALESAAVAKPPARKTTARKPAAKKPAARKPAAKRPAAAAKRPTKG